MLRSLRKYVETRDAGHFQEGRFFANSATPIPNPRLLRHPRAHPRIHAHDAGAAQRDGGGVQSRSRRHHVVDQNNMRRERSVRIDCKRAAHVAPASAGVEFGLRRCVPDARQRVLVQRDAERL